MASVELTDISKTYGAVNVIHGISLHIEDGEFVALVGRPVAENRPCSE